MKVLKVINNNVVSCVDDHGQEAVVMGRGLGFHVKAGMDLDPASAEKIFRMESAEQSLKMQDLVARVTPELLELCTSIVDYAGSTLGRRLNQSIYLTLTDHIQFAMERCRQNSNLQNALLTEVRVFYPEEFTIGCYALEQISLHMGLELPVDEAASIALHLVNAEYDRSMDVTMRGTQVLTPMMEILERNPGLRLKKESLRYNELIVHLKFLAMETFNEKKTSDELPMLPASYLNEIPEAWKAAKEICDYLSGESSKSISGTEAAYLALCIQRAAEPRQ